MDNREKGFESGNWIELVEIWSSGGSFQNERWVGQKQEIP
jgi:hypothetical protein